MSIVSDLVGGAAGGVIDAVGGVVRTVAGDQVQRDQATSAEQMAAQASYQAEWVQRATRSWFDQFVDGMNRLVRPCYTFGTLGLFVWAVADPPAFRDAMAALSTVPEPVWTGCGGILAFWFGSRAIGDVTGWAKRAQSTSTKAAVTTAASPVAKASDPSTPSPVRGALASWNERRKRMHQ